MTVQNIALVKTAAIVGNFKNQLIIPLNYGNLHHGGLGMFTYISEHLLDDPQNLDLSFGVQHRHFFGKVGDHPDISQFRELLDRLFELVQ